MKAFFEIKVTAFLIIRVLLDGALITSNTEGCSHLLLSAEPEHPFPSQNFIFAKKFFASWIHPETFRRKPLWLVCLPVIFLLSMMLIFSCKRWFVKWETVRASFSLFVDMVEVDNQTSQSGLISLAMDFKFKILFKISLDVDDDASFVPTWIIRWLGNPSLPKSKRAQKSRLVCHFT